MQHPSSRRASPLTKTAKSDQTFLKANPLEKEEYLGKGKKEKGLAASLWLMQTAGKKFLSCLGKGEKKRRVGE